jgi:predicted RNase H-like HicB family nuclease
MPLPACIHADWDPDACRWVATSGDVPGLATEAETVEQLLNKLEALVPELLEANGVSDAPAQFELLARRFDPIRPAA